MKTYFTYILANKHKTVLYTGVTNDLKRRLEEHIQGINKSFTHRYNVHFLVWYQEFNWIQDAIEREKEIKGWRREKKDKLIISFNPEWKYLNDKLL